VAMSKSCFLRVDIRDSRGCVYLYASNVIINCSGVCCNITAEVATSRLSSQDLHVRFNGTLRSVLRIYTG
jgi:uncharacterized secreted protein with C-terminal beta-propeller domain